MKKILVIASAMLFGISGAWALGTDAGITINNYATLSFEAGGVSQPDVNSSTDSFVVDRKIDMVLVTTDTDQLDVTPGQQDRITNYAFENEGNADQNFTFSAANLASGAGVGSQADYNTDADNEQVSNIEVQCVYGATTYAWAASVTVDVAEDDNITCQVRADIPAAPTGADTDVMNIRLTAVAVDTVGANETETTVADTQGGTPDIVFADGETHSTLGDDNASKEDVAGDGQELANSGYVIQTPILTATKTSCVISDPVNSTTNPKRIPGAIIRYMFVVSNAGTGDVSDLNLTDTFASELGTGGTDASALYSENANAACVCDPAGPSTGSASGDTTVSGQNLLVEHISVDSGDHSCVWVEVEIQ